MNVEHRFINVQVKKNDRSLNFILCMNVGHGFITLIYTGCAFKLSYKPEFVSETEIVFPVVKFGSLI